MQLKQHKKIQNLKESIQTIFMIIMTMMPIMRRKVLNNESKKSFL